MLQFSVNKSENGQQFVTVFVDGQLKTADDSHPSFKAIVAACADSMSGAAVNEQEVVSLFDVARAIEIKFQRLSERVTVKDGQVLLDGDPVHGTLQNQILDFLEEGEDFEPLVNFYEKMLTNPLGDVREGLYDWITGNGSVTITPEGDLLGYKSVQAAPPEWRTDQATVYVPSRPGEGIVNGRDVAPDEFIEQVPGDVVEMPRSKVLHNPSAACGDGLHIGTYEYARGFTGDTVMLVKFSPRDVVSLPDSKSTWKLRVCRYEVIEAVEEKLTQAVYGRDYDEGLPVGTTVLDANGTKGVIDAALDEDGDYYVIFEDGDEAYVNEEDISELIEAVAKTGNADENGDILTVGDRVVDEDGDEGEVVGFDSVGDPEIKYDDEEYGVGASYASNVRRIHGKGGPTSYDAKGRGKNPAQDNLGRFSAGRPGSQRDSKTGRFAG